MRELTELLKKHWEYILLANEKGSNAVHNADLDVAICIGKSVLINNMNVLQFNSNVQKSILKKYDEIFSNNLDKELLPLNLSSQQIINPLEYDVIGRVYESHIHNNGTRKSSGQFYSPIEAVNYIIESLKLDEVDNLGSKRFIDIACGTGVFLLSTVNQYSRSLIKKGMEEGKVLELCLKNIYGLDINEVSCAITKINLFNLIILNFSPETITKVKRLNFNIYHTNSIENQADIFQSPSLPTDFEIKQRLNEFKDGFDYILGNPPYLEAKKMPKELKEICRANFPDDIFGAFDLYIAFLAQCNRLVADNGIVSMILPNKFTVAKYATKIRRKLLENYSVLELVDLSEMDIFSKADVYPIIFTYKNSFPNESHKVNTKMSVKKYLDLFNEDYLTTVPQTLYKEIGNMSTIFCLPKEGGFEEFFVNLFTGHEKITKFLEFRSTVSFHKKGLREQYVAQNFDQLIDKSNIKKYLGGLSYSKKNEVGRYNINWNEFYINYDNTTLKSIGNALPPIDKFEKEKIIFCQHAKEIIATYDEKGEWVTKDVFPIATSKEDLYNTDLSVKYLTGLLNSKLYSFLYGIVYKGIQISGGYYHFLPTWMGILPIIIPTQKDIRQIEQLVDRALSTSNDMESIIKQIDEKIFEIYSVSEKQKEVIYAFFGGQAENSKILVSN